MRLIFVIGVSLLAIKGIGYGQTNADSLLLQLNHTQNDTVSVDIQNQLSEHYRWSNQALALEYGVKAEKRAQSFRYESGLARAYVNIAAIYTDKGNNELAIETYLKAARFFQKENNSAELSLIYENLGQLNLKIHKPDKALDYFIKNLDLQRTLNDSLGLADASETLGFFYNQQAKYDKALIQFYNSLRLKESLNDKSGMAKAYGNIGLIYFTIGSYEQAQVNLERSLFLFEETPNKIGFSETLGNLAEVYMHQNERQKAIDAITQSLAINKEQNNYGGLAKGFLNLGKIKMASGQKFEAYDHFINSLYYFEKIGDPKGNVDTKLEIAAYFLSTNDIENAKLHLVEAHKLAKANKYLNEEYKCVEMLGNIYLKRGEFYKSAQYFSEGSVLSDSLFAITLAKEIMQVQLQFEFDKALQSKEMDQLRAFNLREIRTQKIKWIRNGIILGIVLLGVLLYIVHRKSKAIKISHLNLEEHRKKIEWQLELLTKQKEELEQANQTKDKFLSIIGHDLRNPFNAINSFVSIVAEHPKDIDDKTMLKYLFLIKEAGSNALSLLDNLLEWAKAQSGQLVPHKQKIALNYILRGNVLLIKELAVHKNIQLIEELEGNPNVDVDKNMINSVIRNLLSNALKFTPVGGKIWIKTTIKNNEVKVMVQDTGVGISDNLLIDLFEPGVIKKGLDGIASSGLGLILCKEFLWHHRQELRVDSKLNYGTTFWFYLPLED